MARANRKLKAKTFEDFIRLLAKTSKARRLKNNLTQREIGQLAKISKKSYERLEQGKPVSLRVAWAVVQVLKVKVVL